MILQLVLEYAVEPASQGPPGIVASPGPEGAVERLLNQILRGFSAAESSSGDPVEARSIRFQGFKKVVLNSMGLGKLSRQGAGHTRILPQHTLGNRNKSIFSRIL